MDTNSINCPGSTSTNTCETDPPAGDPVADLIAAICAEAPELPICDGGGDPPPVDPEGLLEEIVATLCDLLASDPALAEAHSALCAS